MKNKVSKLIIKLISNKYYIFPILLSISCLFMIISLFNLNKNWTIFSLFFLYAILVVDALLDIKNKYILIIFYITFFVFTMGQYLVSDNNSWLYYTYYSLSTIKITIFIQWLALFFTSFSFNVFLKIFKGKKNFKKKNEIFLSQQSLLVILICFFLLSCLVNLETGYRVIKYGYLTLYSNDIPSKIPSTIKYFSSFFPIIVFVSLYLFKKKRYIYTSLILYFVYLCYSLLTGVRGEFVIGILTISIYLFVDIYIKRKIKFNIKNQWRILLVCIFVIPVFLISLNIFNDIRNKQNISNVNLFSQIQSFLINQSSSVNVISTAIENEVKLKQNKTLYTLGPLIDNLENKIKKIIPDFKFYFKDDINTSLAVDVSIIQLGQDGYNSGQGIGSQYLAEVFMDYGYLGVIIYSLLLGILIYFVTYFYNYSLLGYSLSLLVIQLILYLPRGQAIQPINTLLSFNYWFVIVIIIIYSKIIKYFKEDTC